MKNGLKNGFDFYETITDLKKDFGDDTYYRSTEILILLWQAQKNKRPKTKEELVELLKENYTNDIGDIDITNLDFGHFTKTINLSRIKTKGVILQSEHFTYCEIAQSHHKNLKNIYQSNHENKGEIFQERHKNEGFIWQYEHQNNAYISQEGHQNYDKVKEGGHSRGVTLEDILESNKEYAQQIGSIISKKFTPVGETRKGWNLYKTEDAEEIRKFALEIIEK